MLFLRLAALAVVLAGTLALAAPAESATRPLAGKAPTGLRGFVLRADEAPSRVFSRTPSFAWNPVPGAVGYEFQLSTSNVFRDNGLVFEDTDLSTPAASVPMSLPWITGNPYSLYARVRAVLRKTITPWSPAWGFNMRWTALPQPLPAYPGLLRWTPVEGAYAYDVWFLDVGKQVRVTTNVIDQRELYTFHTGSAWTGTVNWRVRAVRQVFDGEKHKRFRPTSQFGPWSPRYATPNPPFAMGPIVLGPTVSDVVSDGTGSAHRLNPGFVWSGTRSTANVDAELARVVVFTDADCLNEVYRGVITGAPAYAPRPWEGPLVLPTTMTGVAGARTRYLASGIETPSVSYDFHRTSPTENLEPAKPTTRLKLVGGAGDAPDELTVDPKAVGAPVDLWDTDWPRGGYYWTVIPVSAELPRPFSASVSVGAAAAALQLVLSSVSGLSAGDVLQVGSGATQESVNVTAVAEATGAVTLASGLTFGHGPGEEVVRTSGAIIYRDLELPQETCAAGRVARFGRSSEPSLTQAGAPFASGLSPAGRLVSATGRARSFYGQPLVAWTPALGAQAYHVQWSKSLYPFRAEPDPDTKAAGKMTYSTAVRLPVTPGTWYYRVRGVNFELPSGSQMMSWSSAVKVVVTKPRFRVERLRR